ncbi:HAD-IA family hydrolase [Candidatus Woesebacteria bacterium]|nr:HAD-IA family hydrolase [Candidatus Woesebacteria bacterium]
MHEKLRGIKALSLDFWKTLANDPSKENRTARGRLIRDRLAPAMEVAEVEALVKVVKHELDDKTQTQGTGVQYGFKPRVQGVYELMPDDKRVQELTEELLAQIDQEQAEIMKQFPPELLESDLIQTLATIKALGLMIVVSSNTGYIDGGHMRAVIEILGLSELIDAYVYSNEVGVAKPSPEFFAKVLEAIGLTSEEVLHIGDNYHADYLGAIAAGMHALHLSSGDDTDSEKIARLSDLI